jgi:peroxiredoxin
MAVTVGQKAPAFAGKAFTQGAFKDIKLDDYKGKWVVLYFFPLAFTPI